MKGDCDMYSIAYYGKDGKGFSGTEPWLYDDYESVDEAQPDKKKLEEEGYQNVSVIPTPKQDH